MGSSCLAPPARLAGPSPRLAPLDLGQQLPEPPARFPPRRVRAYRARSPPFQTCRRPRMLPAADLSEILTNLSVLNLQPNIAAAVLGAVFAPLLRSSEVPQAGLQPGGKPSRRPRRSK